MKCCLGELEMMSSDKKAGIIFTVYMRQEGRITVPKELRDAYDLKEGDLVECQIRKVK
jgi:AbrB family looped-hinge helix DNA binding protein